MSPHEAWTKALQARFPRVSGDEPVTTKVRTAPIKFSPRERG